MALAPLAGLPRPFSILLDCLHHKRKGGLLTLLSDCSTQAESLLCKRQGPCCTPSQQTMKVANSEAGPGTQRRLELYVECLFFYIVR
jgi:hypothetical protein